MGYANKKGGGARNWRKRWWILDNGILYYFKDDFRVAHNKKSKGIGIPQGEIGLLKSDIIWDTNKRRTNKDNALLICTHKRTFYIQPTPQVIYYSNFLLFFLFILLCRKTFLFGRNVHKKACFFVLFCNGMECKYERDLNEK